jgi:uncharacterized membrane protein YvbJ
MITCEACGTQNPSDAAFCSNCARKLDPESQAAVAAQRLSHGATGIRWTIVLITATVLIVAVAVLVVVLVHVA